MKRIKTAIVSLTAIGAIGVATWASATDWSNPVQGWFNPNMKIAINGEQASDSLIPLIVDGKAYIPVAEFAKELGLNSSWNEQEYRIDLSSNQAIEEEMQTSGILLDELVKEADGSTMIHVLGQGTNGSPAEIKLVLTSKTTIVDGQTGEKLTLENLKPNMKVDVTYGNKLTRSLPPIGQAKKVTVYAEHALAEGTLQTITKSSNDDLRLWVSDKENDPTSGVILFANNKTTIVRPNGEPVQLSELKEGDKLRTYYGPIATLSLPAQSQAEMIVLLAE